MLPSLSHQHTTQELNLARSEKPSEQKDDLGVQNIVEPSNVHVPREGNSVPRGEPRQAQLKLSKYSLTAITWYVALCGGAAVSSSVERELT